jgi:hypothetical protein
VEVGDLNAGDEVMAARDVVNLRMNGLMLWGEKASSPVDVVTRLAAMQAQEFQAAKWSVAQRCAAICEKDIERAFAEGEILRTHILRPTWHFVSARDIRWMLELSAPRVHAINRHMYNREGIDEQLARKCIRLLRKELTGRAQLTRAEIRNMLSRGGVDAAGPRLAYILMWAELEAVICSGARKGKQHTYALLEERAPHAQTKSPDDALAELTRRYFATRGPVTVRDFTKWSGLTVAQARTGLEMVGGELDREERSGRIFWYSQSPVPTSPHRGTVDLVQGYDEVISSYGESRMTVPEEALPGGTSPNPPMLHAILSDGRLVGHWKETRRTKEVTIATSFYRPLQQEERSSLQKAVNRLSDFFQLPVRLS